MNEIIEAVKRHASNKFNDIVYTVYDEVDGTEFSVESLKWGELDTFSDRLAGYIVNRVKTNTPIVVYGHKNKYMVVCFMACVKSGHAYVPIDVSTPASRVQDIIDSIDPEIVLATDDGKFSISPKTELVNQDQITLISQNNKYDIDESCWLKAEDTFYIIFTSGSTGKPKGVQITTECLTNYVKWGQNLGGMRRNADTDEPYCKYMPKSNRGGTTQYENTVCRQYRFLNQAPFSFDLSVMDLYLSLYMGGTICAITKGIQKNLKLLYKVFPETDVNVWVSTPSFADICLSDRIYNHILLPNLKYFLFCGEILTNKTAERLQKAFENAVIVNTYGPTESTVCVTEVVIDEDILNTYSPLPVGASRPGTWLYIVDENGNRLPDGDQGEIIIVGDTVSTGYYKNSEQTKKVFSTEVIDGIKYRLYHTGDKGYIKNGQLFYCGRMDFQIKLHGYRIEAEDIENNLVKVGDVEKAVVLPNMEDNRVKSLTAYVVYKGKMESEFKASQEIKNQLKNYVPEYMVPKRIRFVDSIPLTMNGKVDRRALQGNQR